MYLKPVSWSATERLCAARASLPHDELRLWLADLAEPDWATVAENCVSPAERSRAARFAYRAHAQLYLNCRGILRHLLASDLNCRASELAFEYGPAGKPSLCAPRGGQQIGFNVSHAGRWALIAIARDDVGVDIERVRADIDVLEIAREFFTPSELAACSGRSRLARVEAFYRLWTCKEACLKGCGEGIARSLMSLDLTPAVTREHVVVSHARRTWSVISLPDWQGCAAAVAVNCLSPRLSCHLLQANAVGQEFAFA